MVRGGLTVLALRVGDAVMGTFAVRASPPPPLSSVTGPEQLCNLQGSVGTCTDVAAPAPTTSRTGLLIGLGMLAAIAAVALWRRRELKHYLWSI